MLSLAETYFQVVATPLVAIIVDGSAAQVTRGWGQLLAMAPANFSLDPDDPTDKVRKPVMACVMYVCSNSGMEVEVKTVRDIYLYAWALLGVFLAEIRAGR